MTSKILLFLAFMVGGCAAHATPYTMEFPIKRFAISSGQDPWQADGDGTHLVVVNPTPYKVKLEVVCQTGENWDGHEYWAVTLNPHSEMSGLAQTMKKDEILNVCSVSKWEKLNE